MAKRGHRHTAAFKFPTIAFTQKSTSFPDPQRTVRCQSELNASSCTLPILPVIVAQTLGSTISSGTQTSSCRCKVPDI